MQTPIRYSVLEHVVALVAQASALVQAIHRRDRDLACQVRRALSSIGLNVAEAFGNDAGNARLRFRTARGSLYEAEAGIRIAIGWGYVSQAQAAGALASIDALGARIYGLSRSS